MTAAAQGEDLHDSTHKPHLAQLHTHRKDGHARMDELPQHGACLLRVMMMMMTHHHQLQACRMSQQRLMGQTVCYPATVVLARTRFSRG